MTDNFYAERDAMQLDIDGGYYSQHVSAMTSESLHSKGDVAAELGFRDMQIDQLKKQVEALAAENIALKHAMSVTLEHVSVTDAGQAGVAAMIMNDALYNTETPATDAAIREIEARGVDKFADDWQRPTPYSRISEMARDYANKLRSVEMQP